MGSDDPRSSKCRLIAVDDEAHNLDYIERCLHGWDVLPFTSPLAALDEAISLSPSLMIVDYRMPEMNGVELVKSLRASGVDCPVLMLTAYPELEEAVFVEQSNLLFLIMAKPITPAFLRQQVEQCAASSRHNGR